MPNFQTFKKTTTPGQASTSVITLGKSGSVTIGALTHKALGEPKAVKLLWDPGERLIAVAVSAPEDEDSYSARNRVIQCSGFHGFIGLKMERSRRYPVKIEDGMAIIALDGPYEEIVDGYRLVPVVPGASISPATPLSGGFSTSRQASFANATRSRPGRRRGSACRRRRAGTGAA